MKAHKLIYDPSTFGITGKSLKMLRNSIALHMRDEIAVIEVPTGDILCGFLVLNKTQGTATWSGDGFRTDGGGEGGRGYNFAIKMFYMFGAQRFCVYSLETIRMFSKAINSRTTETGLASELLEACNKAAEEIYNSDFKCLIDSIPNY